MRLFILFFNFIFLTFLSLEASENKQDYVIDENAKVRESTDELIICLLYTSPSPRDGLLSRMPSSA